MTCLQYFKHLRLIVTEKNATKKFLTTDRQTHKGKSSPSERDYNYEELRKSLTMAIKFWYTCILILSIL